MVGLWNRHHTCSRSHASSYAYHTRYILVFLPPVISIDLKLVISHHGTLSWLSRGGKRGKIVRGGCKKQNDGRHVMKRGIACYPV